MPLVTSVPGLALLVPLVAPLVAGLVALVLSVVAVEPLLVAALLAPGRPLRPGLAVPVAVAVVAAALSLLALLARLLAVAVLLLLESLASTLNIFHHFFTSLHFGGLHQQIRSLV